MFSNMMKTLALSAAIAHSVHAEGPPGAPACTEEKLGMTELDFFDSKILQNDLQYGGKIIYGNIGTVRDRPVQLHVSVVDGTTYESERADVRNGKSGKFGQINLFTDLREEESGEGNFRFCFHDEETGEETKVGNFHFSIYDVDERNAAQNGIKEKLIIDTSQATKYFLDENTELKTKCENEDEVEPCTGRTIFHSSTKGTGKDNPKDPTQMTAKQIARSVVFEFKDTACFELTYNHYCPKSAVTNGEEWKCKWYGGGNFMFAGNAPQVVETGECVPLPTASPTASPTETPTDAPTPKLEKRGASEDGDDPEFPPNECESDVELIMKKGTTDFVDTAVQILSKDTQTVKVALNQVWADARDIDAIFYEYKEDKFNSKCYESNEVATGTTYDEITLQCNVMKPFAQLKLCLVDAEDKSFLSRGDDATIPRCCHEEEEYEKAGTPTVCYELEINCKPGCEEGEAQEAVRYLRG